MNPISRRNQGEFNGSNEVGNMDKPPLIARTSIFVAAIAVLVLSWFPFFGIPFGIAGMIYVLKIRKQGVALWSAGKAENARLEEEVRRIGAMDHVQKAEDVRRLDETLQSLRSQVRTSEDQLQESQRKADEVSRSIKDYDEAITIDNQISKKNQQLNSINKEVGQLKEKVVDLQEMVDLNDFGLYNFENPADDSVHYKDELAYVKDRYKELTRRKEATSATKNFTYNGSDAKGRKMVNDMSKLLLRAFNAEVENSIKTVRAGHLAAAKKRLERSATAVERLGQQMDIKIGKEYLNLREKELELTHAHLEAVKAAKEEEREARRVEREERQAQKEFLAEKAKQEKEVEHYRSALQAVIERGDKDEIARATTALGEAEEKLADVENTMANTRAGYVYVASNRGAFGPEIVKIGMTRRLDPSDRIRELSDASVPFNFEAHAMIFSDDAVGLERALHEHFAEHRVNLINMRREYFYTTPARVKDALIEHEVNILEYHENSEATEYEASRKLRDQEDNQPSAQFAVAR